MKDDITQKSSTQGLSSQVSTSLAEWVLAYILAVLALLLEQVSKEENQSGMSPLHSANLTNHSFTLSSQVTQYLSCLVEIHVRDDVPPQLRRSNRKGAKIGLFIPMIV